MFDWPEYDNIVKKGFEEQEKQISEFLKRYIAKNAQIRELPLFDRPDKEAGGARPKRFICRPIRSSARP